MIAPGVGPSNGRALVAISYNTTPNDHRSLVGSTGCPRACSGDMYEIVPRAEHPRRPAAAGAPDMVWDAEGSSEYNQQLSQRRAHGDRRSPAVAHRGPVAHHDLTLRRVQRRDDRGE